MKIKYFTCPKCGHTDYIEIEDTSMEIVCICCGNKPDNKSLSECIDDLETF